MFPAVEGLRPEGFSTVGERGQARSGRIAPVPQKKRGQTGETFPVQVQLKGVTLHTSGVSGVKRDFPYWALP